MPVPYSAAADALEEYRQRRAEREMREALAADGEKLRQLTGEDHGPFEIVECEACAGRGYHQRRITVYEQGCGFSHDDTHEIPCDACGGTGEFICESEGDPQHRSKP